MIKKIKKLIEFIKDVFKVVDENIEEPDLKPIEKENIEEPIIEQVKVEKVLNDLKTPLNSEYKYLTKKERQKYLKEIGLYDGKVDGIIGDGSKNAIEQFNVIFLDKKTSSYFIETDKLLREFYASYKKSKYMQDSDWEYFKNFGKSQYKCKCKGEYCNGYPHKIYKRTVMKDQYARNYHNKPYTITSGLRCKQHNLNEGGIRNSKHLYGRASDGYISNLSSKKLRATINKLKFINYSYDVSSNVVHSDIKK